MGLIPKNSSFEMCKSCFDAYTELVSNPERHKVVLNKGGVRVIRFNMLQIDKLYLRNLSSYFLNRIEHFRRCVGNSGNKIITTDSNIAYLFLGYDNATLRDIGEIKKLHEKEYCSHILIFT